VSRAQCVLSNATHLPGLGPAADQTSHGGPDSTENGPRLARLCPNIAAARTGATGSRLVATSKNAGLRGLAGFVVRRRVRQNGLSRRRSRVRVPSLPLHDLPANRLIPKILPRVTVSSVNGAGQRSGVVGTRR